MEIKIKGIYFESCYDGLFGNEMGWAGVNNVFDGKWV